jgi:uncharacterized protein (DUF433 family)/DNA-binding transcriptional MerR regulator
VQEYDRRRDEGGDVSAVLAFDGCYDARRTAALSGVPRSIVYDWARKGIVVPSISAEREKLWSYADLLALRIVSWLRHPKRLAADVRPSSAMRQIREALAQLDEQGLDLWDGGADATLHVDRASRVVIVTAGVAHDVSGHDALLDCLDLLGPFEGIEGVGPDLRRPRKHLRIVPGKCAGEPHLDGSRLTTRTVAALADRGYTLDDVARLYPDESHESLAEAIDLERSLRTLIPAV